MGKIRVGILLVILAVLVFFSLESSLEKKIIGTWYNMSNNIYTQYDFKEDGKCSVIDGGFFSHYL